MSDALRGALQGAGQDGKGINLAGLIGGWNAGAADAAYRKERDMQPDVTGMQSSVEGENLFRTLATNLALKHPDSQMAKRDLAAVAGIEGAGTGLEQGRANLESTRAETKTREEMRPGAVRGQQVINRQGAEQAKAMRRGNVIGEQFDLPNAQQGFDARAAADRRAEIASSLAGIESERLAQEGAARVSQGQQALDQQKTQQGNAQTMNAAQLLNELLKTGQTAMSPEDKARVAQGMKVVEGIGGPAFAGVAAAPPQARNFAAEITGATPKGAAAQKERPVESFIDKKPRWSPLDMFRQPVGKEYVPPNTPPIQIQPPRSIPTTQAPQTTVPNQPRVTGIQGQPGPTFEEIQQLLMQFLQKGGR